MPARDIQRLVEQAERDEKRARNGKRKRSAVVVGSERWREAKRRREMREAAKGRIDLLRSNLRQAREQSRKEVAQLRRRRDLSREKLGREIKKFRAKWRAWVNEQVAEFRAKHRAAWKGKIDRARVAVERARLELRAERGYQADYRRMVAAQRKAARARPKAKRTARFHKAESDYQVEQNIDPDLVGVWRKVKNRIRTATARKSRTEAFLEWVSENPDEVAALREELAEEARDALEEELAAQEAAHYGG